MRDRIANRLRSGGTFQLAPDAGSADAVLTGTGRIWTIGYASIGVHPSQANRQPVFDGFLSVEIQSKQGTTLWSYLVTPSKFTMKPITTDLADQVVRKLLASVEENPSTPAESPGKSMSAVSIHGAGATFPWPLYQKWFESFETRSPNIHIEYDPIGSEAGIRLLSDGGVDFAASDMPLSDAEITQSKIKLRQFPSVLGAVVPVYNLKVNLTLNFTPESLAGIYLGTIRKWNDSAIRAANPGVSLPDREIIVVHRSDGSGTTFALTDYLSKVSAEWKERVGPPASSISWPIGRGVEHNEGVAALVSKTPDSIGYVESIYAIQHELRSGSVRNAAGNFVKASLASVTAAAREVSDSGGSDFRFSVTNAPGKDAYPITTFTWFLLPVTDGQNPKTPAFVEFVRWALTSGQKECSALGYAPVPASIVNQEIQALSALE